MILKYIEITLKLFLKNKHLRATYSKLCRIFRAGEGIQTLDFNLGKVA